MDNEFEEEPLVFYEKQDYFTLNNFAFFRILRNTGHSIAAKLFVKDDDGIFKEIETGIYPYETIINALQWDEEDYLELEYPNNATT